MKERKKLWGKAWALRDWVTLLVLVGSLLAWGIVLRHGALA